MIKYFSSCKIIEDTRTNKKYTLTKQCKEQNIGFLKSTKGEKIND